MQLVCDPGATISITATLAINPGISTLHCLYTTSGAFTLSFNGTILDPPYTEIFNPANGGTIKAAQRVQYPGWFGAIDNTLNLNSPVDGTTAFQNVLSSLAYASNNAGVANLHIPSGVWYSGSITKSSCVSIDGDGANSTILIFNGTSGADFITDSSGCAYHFNGLFIEGTTGHVPANILNLSGGTDIGNEFEDLWLKNASADCLKITYWNNITISNQFRADGCGQSNIHLITGNTQFGGIVNIDNFTVTSVEVAGGGAAASLIWLDNQGGTTFAGTVQIHHARLENNYAMIPPYSFIRFSGNSNNSWIVPTINDIFVSDAISQSGMTFLNSDVPLLFSEGNIYFPNTAGNWFGGGGFPATVTGLQALAGATDFITPIGSYQTLSTVTPTLLPHVLGLNPTCAVQSAAGVGATCAVLNSGNSNSFTSSASSFLVQLVTGSSGVLTGSELGLISLSPSSNTLWNGLQPNCWATLLGQHVQATDSYQNLFVYPTNNYQIRIDDNSGGLPTGKTYNIMVGCP